MPASPGPRPRRAAEGRDAHHGPAEPARDDAEPDELPINDEAEPDPPDGGWEPV